MQTLLTLVADTLERIELTLFILLSRKIQVNKIGFKGCVLGRANQYYSLKLHALTVHKKIFKLFLKWLSIDVCNFLK